MPEVDEYICPGAWSGVVGATDPCLECGEVFAAHGPAPRPQRIVSWSEGVDRLLAIDAQVREQAREKFESERGGIEVTTDEHGTRTLTVSEHDLAYVLARFADEMVDRGYTEASRPSGASDEAKAAQVADAALPLGPVAQALLDVTPDTALTAATEGPSRVLRSLDDLADTRYDCDCQVGGPDARSIDADYLAAVTSDARDLIVTLLVRTTDTGVMTVDVHDRHHRVCT